MDTWVDRSLRQLVVVTRVIIISLNYDTCRGPVGNTFPGSLLVNGLIWVAVTPTGLLKIPVPFQVTYGIFSNVLLLL